MSGSLPEPEHDKTPASDRGPRLRLLAEGIACLNAKQFERAQQLAGQAASIDVRDPDAWHLLGVALAGLGNHAHAADAIARAIALNPNSAQFHANLGNAQFQQAEYAKAIGSYSPGGRTRQTLISRHRSCSPRPVNGSSILGSNIIVATVSRRRKPVTRACCGASRNAPTPCTCWACLPTSAATTRPRPRFFRRRSRSILPFRRSARAWERCSARRDITRRRSLLTKRLFSLSRIRR